MKEVAVICPSYITYLTWLKENSDNPEERYTWVDHLKPIIGKRFDRVEKLYKWYKIEDIDEVLDYLESHMKDEKRM
jgi:hypothetical protein